MYGGETALDFDDVSPSYGQVNTNQAPVEQPSYQAPPQQSSYQAPPQQSSYQKPPYNNQGQSGGYQKPPYNGGAKQYGNGGGFQKQGFDGQKKQWPKKQREEFGPIELYKPYAGIANKGAPPAILEAIARIVKDLDAAGFMLRSDGSDGPGDVYEASANRKEVHLPWREFNNKDSKHTFNQKEAFELAKMFHPAFEGLTPAVKAFMARNARVILGKDLKSPVMFVLCWSEDGVEHARDKTSRTGNVGHSIAIASALRVPIFNLQKADAEQRLRAYVGL